MASKLILHIPHSSNAIPNKEGYTVTEAELESEMLKLTDWYTDDLFDVEFAVPVRAGFSRIFCDPERFTDDAQEVMAQYGMGVLYERSDNGKRIRNVSPELREEILRNHYWKHHGRLNEAVNEQLDSHAKALIVDCHSYPSVPLVRDLDKTSQRPDFNIGTDDFHTPQYLIDVSVKFFEDKGYSLGVDWPYKGTLVPMDHYQKSKNVESIMLEINRALYLEEPGNDISDRYNETKEVVAEFLAVIKSAFDQR